MEEWNQYGNANWVKVGREAAKETGLELKTSVQDMGTYVPMGIGS